MKITFQRKTDPTTPTIIALFEGQKADQELLGKSKAELLTHHLKRKNFKGEIGEVFLTHLIDRLKTQKIMLFGLGKEKKFQKKEARNAAAQMIKAAKAWREKMITLVIPEKIHSFEQEFAEGLVLGNYDPAMYKTGEERKKKEKAVIQTVDLIAKRWTKEHERLIKKATFIAETVHVVRDLVNAGPNQLNTEQFVKETKRIAKKYRHRCTDIKKRQLMNMGMGGILAVNRGSEQPAHLLILEHNAKRRESPIVIVGKGVIFDTGGVNLKPSASLQEMHLDMAGAAVILGIFQLLKTLNINRRIIGMMPITDNAIGSKAYRPSEIITTYSGKTVEVMNTDAEGRMILCDALSYGVKKYKPKIMIDLATLTGACMVALGYRTAGLFGNDSKIMEQIKASADRTDESVCSMPITDADEKSMKGKLADLTNLAADHPYAGAPRGAAFLKNFVGKTPWAHIDIAGTAYTKDPKDYEVPMATGYGVRLMIDFLEHLP